MEEHGKVRLRLAELIEEYGISRAVLSRQTSIGRTQIERFCKDPIIEIDVGVLARLCAAFDCEISELLQYVPPQGP